MCMFCFTWILSTCCLQLAPDHQGSLAHHTMHTRAQRPHATSTGADIWQEHEGNAPEVALMFMLMGAGMQACATCSTFFILFYLLQTPALHPTHVPMHMHQYTPLTSPTHYIQHMYQCTCTNTLHPPPTVYLHCLPSLCAQLGVDPTLITAPLPLHMLVSGVFLAAPGLLLWAADAAVQMTSGMME